MLAEKFFLISDIAQKKTENIEIISNLSTVVYDCLIFYDVNLQQISLVFND